MKILIAIGSVRRGAGGPSVMLAGLTNALIRLGHDITIFCQNPGGQGELLSLNPAAHLLEFDTHWPKQYAPNSKMLDCLINEAQSADLVHNFGMWLGINRYSGIAALRCKKTFVYSPQGMLEKSALGRSRWKKKIAMALWEKRNLKIANCFHATGDNELASVRRFGPANKPVTMIPNGVDLPNNEDIATRQELENFWPRLKDREYFIYLGRLHPYKSPETLCGAWLRSGKNVQKKMLIFAGPDFNGHSKIVTNMAESAGKSDDLIFTGAVDGRLKNGLLANALALVLPSKSENFGNVVIESLACKTPVVTNQNAPWEIVEQNRCGWWIESGEIALSRVLEKVASLSVDERKQMGERGYSMVKKYYAWDKIGADMAATYHWLVNGGDRPACMKLC